MNEKGEAIVSLDGRKVDFLKVNLFSIQGCIFYMGSPAQRGGEIKNKWLEGKKCKI